MATFVLVNRHEQAECDATYAAWRGFESPLRRRPPSAGCIWNDHRLWWEVEAEDPDRALALLPRFVAARTETNRVAKVPLP